MLNEHIVFAWGDVYITNYGFFAALSVLLSAVCFYVLNLLCGANARRYVMTSLLFPTLGAVYVIVRNLSGETIGGVELAAAQLAAVPVQIVIGAVSAAVMRESVARAADGMTVSAALGWAVFSLCDVSGQATAEFGVYFAIFAFLAVNFYLQYVGKTTRGGNVCLVGIVMLGAAGFVFSGMSDCGIWVLGGVNLVRVFWCAAAVVSAAVVIIRGVGGKAVLQCAICAAMWLAAICCDMSANAFVAEHVGIITGALLLVMCADVYYCHLAGMRKRSKAAVSKTRRRSSAKGSINSGRDAADDDYKELLSMYSERNNPSRGKNQR